MNREVFKYVFMALFLGMATVSHVIIGCTYIYLTGPAATLIMITAGLYLIGVFSVIPARQAIDSFGISLGCD